MFPSASCQTTSKIVSAGASAKAILTSPWGSASRSRSSASARDGRPPAGVHGPLARRDGGAGAGARRAAGVRGDRARRPRAAARVARLPRGAFAAALCGDGIPEMIQGPDIGKVIFEHTSDSHVIEWPFGLETHLPTDWVIFGVNVSPTKHVVFMGIAAALVFLTIWYG